MNIEFIRKKVKNLRITIKRDKTVMVSIPLFMDKKTAQKFVDKKMPWIEKHLKRLDLQKKYAFDEDVVYIWGLPYKKETKISAKNHCVIEDDRLIISVKDEGRVNATIDKFLRKEITKKAEVFLEEWRQKTGIDICEMRIRDMKTRWGSCNIQKKRIWLSLRLIHYDVDCLSYVVLHEVLHIKEKYHNKRFYRLLGNYKPDWKASKLILNG